MVIVLSGLNTYNNDLSSLEYILDIFHGDNLSH